MFITFEGNEGSGKTTLLNKLAEHLSGEGHDILKTKEPGSPHNGACQEIRRIVLDPEKRGKVSEQSELYLMLADRCNHVENVVRPALARGQIVLSDRHIDSTYAYQGWGRQNGDPKATELIDALNRHVTGGLLPDLSFFITVDPEIGCARATKTEFGRSDRFESEAILFHTKVVQGYWEIYSRNHMVKEREIIMLDTSQVDAEETFKSLLQAFEMFRHKVSLGLHPTAE